MRPTKKLRLRLPAPAWPSKDHRDYQTRGLLGRRSRREVRAADVQAHDSLAHAPGPTALSTIDSIRDEDACLQVQIVTAARLTMRTPGDTPAVAVASHENELARCVVTLSLN